MLRKSSQGGATFEELLGNVLNTIIANTTDSIEPVGLTVGRINRCKVGDFLITLGEDSPTPNERIIVEAKRDAAYNLARALDECTIAMKNRDAKVAVFVYDRAYGERKFFPSLAKHGDIVIALWDSEDPATDIFVKAAVILAKCLIKPNSIETENLERDQRLLDNVIAQIIDLVPTLDSMRKASEEVIRRGQGIVSNALTIESVITSQLEALQLYARYSKVHAQ